MMNLQKFEVYLLVENNYDKILVAVICGLLTSVVIKKLKKSSGSIPGRLGLPLVGESFSFLWAMNSAKGCYDFVRVRRLRYGNWFKTRLFGEVHVFVPSAAGAKTILSNEYQFRKTMMKAVTDAVGEKSLASLPAETHKPVKRLLSGPLSIDSLSSFVPKFHNLLSSRFNKLAQDGKSFLLLDFNMKITCDAICEMLMSIRDESLLNRIERECLTVSKGMMSLPVMIPGSGYYKGMKARERLMELFQEIITSRRSSQEPHRDFLQSMLERDSFPADEKLDDSQIMDNILTIILGGLSTTATAMMWGVKFLDDNKQVQNMLREEQFAILRNKPRGASLSLEDLNNMSYCSKVVKETLRMSNVVPWVPRIAKDDCKIEEFNIKKGWTVNVDFAHIHYDQTLHKDPMKFNPSRVDEIQKPYSYMPYGIGPRTCLGINMANVIMLVYLHTLTSGYKWIVNNHDLSLEKGNVIPTLKSRLPITINCLNDEN